MEQNNAAQTRTTEETFRHFDADEIKTDVGVSGWVPKQNVEPLTDELDDAMVQYWTDDGLEAFVTTL